MLANTGTSSTSYKVLGPTLASASTGFGTTQFYLLRYLGMDGATATPLPLLLLTQFDRFMEDPFRNLSFVSNRKHQHVNRTAAKAKELAQHDHFVHTLPRLVRKYPYCALFSQGSWPPPTRAIPLTRPRGNPLKPRP